MQLEDRFWKPRLVTQKNTLVPWALKQTVPAVDNRRKTITPEHPEETTAEKLGSAHASLKLIAVQSGKC